MTYKPTLAEMQDAFDSANEFLFEIETQHGSECSLYGDSWPGALHDIETARKVVTEIEHDIDAALCQAHVQVWEAYTLARELFDKVADTGDIPF